MILYYDNLGKLNTIIPHGEIPRQGDSSLNLYVYFKKDYYDANYTGFNLFVRYKFADDINYSGNMMFMTDDISEDYFEPIENEEEVERVGGLEENVLYRIYKIAIPDIDKWGKMSLVLEFQNSNNVVKNLGKAEIYIEKTLGFGADLGLGMTRTEYEILLAILNAQEVEISNRVINGVNPVPIDVSSSNTGGNAHIKIVKYNNDEFLILENEGAELSIYKNNASNKSVVSLFSPNDMSMIGNTKADIKGNDYRLLLDSNGFTFHGQNGSILSRVDESGIKSVVPFYYNNKELATKEYVQNGYIELSGRSGTLTQAQIDTLFNSGYEDPVIIYSDTLVLHRTSFDFNYATYQSYGINITDNEITLVILAINILIRDGVYNWTYFRDQKSTYSKARLDTLFGTKENLENKVSSWSGTPNDTNYPTEKLVKDSLDDKEDSSNKVSSWSANPDNVNYPTEKLVKDSLDEKITNGVTNGQVNIKNNTDINIESNNSLGNLALNFYDEYVKIKGGDQNGQITLLVGGAGGNTFNLSRKVGNSTTELLSVSSNGISARTSGTVNIYGNGLRFNNNNIATENYVNTSANSLQEQIDGINAGQNLVDIVADLTALNNLSTTNLQVNDKVQVLRDSNHDNAGTVYRWDGIIWDYIGQYGSDSYTKAEVNSLLAGKQNVINGQNKLSSDLVDDSAAANKFVTAAEKTKIANAEDFHNKVTSVSSQSTDTEYPSAKCLYDNLDLYTPLNLTSQEIDNLYDESFVEAEVVVNGNVIQFTNDVIEVSGNIITITADSTFAAGNEIYL